MLRKKTKNVMKKILSLILAILTVSVLMSATVSAANAPVPENSEYISLDLVEVEKKGNNLASLFTPFAKTESAPEGANGNKVYKAAMSFIGGTNGGACICVDLKDYDLEGKKVCIRYYVDDFTHDNEFSMKLAENGNSARGTDHLPTNYPEATLVKGEWALLDITNGVDYFLCNSAGDNGEDYPELATTNFGFTVWAGLSGGDGKTVNVYIDGIYLVSEKSSAPETGDTAVYASIVALTVTLAGAAIVIGKKKYNG